MGLKEKLESEARDLKKAEDDAAPKAAVALGAVQQVLDAVRNFFIDIPSAKITTGTTNLESKLKAWNAVQFPTMQILLRQKKISIVPAGPFQGSLFRVNVNGPDADYALVWNGTGNSLREWSIVRQSGDRPVDESKLVNRDSLDEAFQRLVGF